MHPASVFMLKIMYSPLIFLNKQNLKLLIIAIPTVLASVFFVYTLKSSVVGAVYNNDESSSYISSSSPIEIGNSSGVITASTTLSYDVPIFLQIPSLKINAKVQKTGLTAKKTMGIPTNFTDVAWYKYGTVPGEVGSAVIDGHVDNGLSLPGVFKHLDEIKLGDDIYVVDSNNQKIHFIVSSIDSYPYKNVPTKLIFNENDKSILRLITCGGKWVPQDKTYDMRLVVTAILVEDRS